LLGGIVEGKVEVDIAAVGFGIQAALVVNVVVVVVVELSSEDLTNELAFIGTANIFVGVVALVTTALEGVVAVLGEEVVLAAELARGVEWCQVAAFGVGWGADVEFSGDNCYVSSASTAAAVDLLERRDLL
jgi:hypothetical protein